jgi:hypothetical protein
VSLAITSVAGTITVTTSLQESSGISGQQLAMTPRQSVSISLGVGSGADQCSKFVAFTGSVTSGAPVSHDLTGGTTFYDLTTGAPVAFSRIAGIIVFNDSSANVLQIGGGSNAFAHLATAHNVRPSTTTNPGIYIALAPDATGFVVTAGTGDIFKVDASAGTVTYRVLMWGS